MCKFIQPSFKLMANNLHYILKAQKSYKKYYKFLQDDFSPIKNIFNLIEFVQPYFWIVTDYENKYMGFVYLDNFVGNGLENYSAELSTCFDKCAWGNFTKYSAKIFLKKCFDEFHLTKIKAQIYPENFRIKKLLKDSGFKHEATLKNETKRLGIAQDIEVYGLYRNYYYKK